MDFKTPYLSPSLPGAWSSTWTLSQDLESETEMAPKVSKHIHDYTAEASVLGRPAVMKTYAFCDPEGAEEQQGLESADTDGTDCDDDQDSIAGSDDFYSFISHQDTDTTLNPSVQSISSIKGAEISEHLPDPLDLSGSAFNSSDSSSSSHIPTPEDGSLSDDVCFDSAVRSTAAHQIMSTSRSSSPSPSNPQSPMANVSDPDKASVISTASKRFWSESLGSSDNHSLAPRDESSDCASVHYDYSMDYANVCDLITRLDAGNASGDSIDSWARSSSRNARRHGLEASRSELQRNTLQFPQPDGDDPWTLSLDPTLTSTESMSHSSTSLSFMDPSHNASNEDGSSIISHDNVPLSFRSPSLIYHEHDETRTTRLSSGGSVYGISLEQSGPEYTTPAPLPFIAYPQTKPTAPKNVIQKTKDLCSKFKKFVTSKGSRQKSPQQSNKASSPIRRVGLDLLDSEIPPPFPQTSSHSFNYFHQGFRRTPKLSTTSVPLHSNIAGSTISNGDERRTYGHHPSPKNLKEIKSRRRFSLPVFAGASSSNDFNPKQYKPSSTNKRRQPSSIRHAQDADYVL